MLTSLITGASGFIGQHLARALRAQGQRVVCLVRKTSKTDRLVELGCELVFGDVTAAESLPTALQETQPASIYHLAGLTKARSKQQLFAVNERGTRNLLTAAAELSTPPTVVIVSTLATAGPAINGQPKAESDAVAPVSYYGKSKLAGEKVAAAFAEKMPISVVRPPIVLGPNDRDGFEIFRAISGLGVHPVPLRRPMSVSWIHADDLVRALIRVRERAQRLGSLRHGEGVYFATSDEIIDYTELGKVISHALGKPRVRMIRTGPYLVWAVATANEAMSILTGNPHIMNFDKAREATAGSWICSGEKLAQETGFACQLSLRECLESCVRWYREAGWLR